MQRVATLETVEAAVKQLAAENKEASIRNIQSITGGSFTTIKQLLRQLEEQKRTPPVTVEAPAELLDLGSTLAATLVQRIYQQCHDGAQEEIAAIRHEAEEKVQQSVAELKEAEGEIQTLEGEISHYEKRVAELEGQLSTCQQEKQALQVTVARLEERALAQQTHIGQLEEALRSKEDLESRLSQLESRLGGEPPIAG